MANITYVEAGVEYTATPLGDEEMRSLGLTSCSGSSSDQCSGDYECRDGTRYKCMWDDSAKTCRWFRTSDTC